MEPGLFADVDGMPLPRWRGALSTKDEGKPPGSSVNGGGRLALLTLTPGRLTTESALGRREAAYLNGAGEFGRAYDTVESPDAALRGRGAKGCRQDGWNRSSGLAM